MSEYKPFKMRGSPMQRNYPESFRSSSSGKSDNTPLEKFDWGSALSGAVKGAKAGSVAGPWGIVAGALGGGAVGGFAGGAQMERQEAEQDLATKSAEEKDAMLLKAAENAKKSAGNYSE